MNKAVRIAAICLATFSIGLGLGVLVKRHVMAKYTVPTRHNEFQPLGTISPPSPSLSSIAAAQALPLRDTSSTGEMVGPIPPAIDLPASKVNNWILMYHYIGEPPDSAVDPIGYNLTIRPNVLDAQITALANAGYSSITLQDAALGKAQAREIILTFDDGYEDFYTHAWPILQHHGWKATIFIITGKVGTPGYMTWDQLKELAHAGVDIGAHTVNHIDMAVATPERQNQEIMHSKSILERQLGIKVTTFAYPSGRYTPLTLLLVHSGRFNAAVTTHSGQATPRYDAFELPRLRISPQLTLTQLQNELKKR